MHVESQNAITAPQGAVAAMSGDNSADIDIDSMSTDELGEYLRNQEKDPQQQAPQGQPDAVVPKVEQPKEELPEKFRGKSAAEIAKSASEAEKLMHEATQAKAKAEKDLDAIRQQLSEAQRARIEYERMLLDRQNAQKDNGSAKKSNPADERFFQHVNENPEVLEAVAGVAQDRLMPQIKTVEDRLEKIDRNLAEREFKVEMQNLITSRPGMQERLPEVQQTALQVLEEIYQGQVNAGIQPELAFRHIQSLNISPRFAVMVDDMVIGKKGKDYWAGILQNEKAPQDDPAKVHLGGGGGSPSSSEVDRELSSEEFSRLGTKEMEAYLRKMEKGKR